MCFSIPVKKLLSLGLDDALCCWMLSYLLQQANLQGPWLQNPAQSEMGGSHIYRLHKLKEFYVDHFLLELFYLAVIRIILAYGCTLWGGSCTKRGWMRISRVVRLVSKSLTVYWKMLMHPTTLDCSRRPGPL